MRNASKCVIVSRHSAAVEFIKKAAGPNLVVAEIFPGNVSPEDVRGAIVYGNIPFHIAAAADLVVAIEFNGSPPRGQEYTLEDMESAGARLTTYQVFRRGTEDTSAHIVDDSDGEPVYEIDGKGQVWLPGQLKAAQIAGQGIGGLTGKDE